MRPAASAIRRWREQPATFVREVFQVVPDAWQNDVLEAFPHNPRLAIKSCKGPGKAQPSDLQIETPDGPRRFGDLRPGDYVFAEDGTPTEVTGVYDRGVRDVHEVVFDDGSSTVCCGEHLWKVRGRTEKRHKTWSVLSLDEIMRRGVQLRQGVGYYNQFQIPQPGAARFPERGGHPYLVGVWLGDGTTGRSNYTSEDKEIADRLVGLGYQVARKTSKDRCDTFAFTHQGLHKHLAEMGIYRLGSHERHVPDHYLRTSIESRMELLRGLMDTDGTIDASDSCCEFNTTSEKLAENVIWLVRSLGGKARLRKTKKTTHRDCYRVCITTAFNPFHLPRKAARWRSSGQERYHTRTIVDVRPAGRTHTLCIAVNHPSRCYLTNDFIVTHNTCLLAWLVWNYLLTRPHPKIVCTSITGDNLADGLWTELAKWHGKSPLLKELFEWRKTRVESKQAPETWWAAARTWPRSADAQSQADTLAGLHADYVLFVLDEAGGIPDSVVAAAEATLANVVDRSKQEAHLLLAGNPTHLEGPLYRACTTERHLWHVTEITSDPDDPKRTPRVSIEWAQQQIEKYGRDNPWVLVNVFGRFPPSSLNSLLGPDDVRDAMARVYREEHIGHAAKVLGVDVARFGDDASVIFPRQGLVAFDPITLRNVDSLQGGAQVARKWQDWGAHATFIDSSGGYGVGWIDQLRVLKYNPIGISFAGKPNNQGYYNKRTEMHFALAEWVKAGGALPNVPELVAELTVPTYCFKGDKIILEPKEHIKERLGRSPDYADALCLTFAQPVAPPSVRTVIEAAVARQSSGDWDPWA